MRLQWYVILEKFNKSLRGFVLFDANGGLLKITQSLVSYTAPKYQRERYYALKVFWSIVLINKMI